MSTSVPRSALSKVVDQYLECERVNFQESYGVGCSKEDLRELFENHIYYQLLILDCRGDMVAVEQEFEKLWKEIDDSEDSDNEVEVFERTWLCKKCDETFEAYTSETLLCDECSKKSK